MVGGAITFLYLFSYITQREIEESLTFLNFKYLHLYLEPGFVFITMSMSLCLIGILIPCLLLSYPSSFSSFISLHLSLSSFHSLTRSFSLTLYLYYSLSLSLSLSQSFCQRIILLAHFIIIRYFKSTSAYEVIHATEQVWLFYFQSMRK